MNFKLRIARVDMDGYLGRENHPHPSDIGLVVTPLSMATYWFDPEGEEETLLLVDGGICADTEKAADTENHDVFWVAVTDDGRTLDLVGHEVEVVR